MSASVILGRPVQLPLHLLSTNLKLHRTRPVSHRPIRLFCSLENNHVTPQNDLAVLNVPVGKHLDLTDQLYGYILRHTREPQVLQSQTLMKGVAISSIKWMLCQPPEVVLF